VSEPEQIKIAPPPVDPNETRENRLKRLHMRSMRRGIKEMDLILSAFAENNLADMAGEELDLYDALLLENDQDLYTWVTGAVPAPPRFASMIARVSSALQTD